MNTSNKTLVVVISLVVGAIIGAAIALCFKNYDKRAAEFEDYIQQYIDKKVADDVTNEDLEGYKLGYVKSPGNFDIWINNAIEDSKEHDQEIREYSKIIHFFDFSRKCEMPLSEALDFIIEEQDGVGCHGIPTRRLQRAINGKIGCQVWIECSRIMKESLSEEEKATARLNR